ncbi:protein SPMIP2-like [Ptychodera flava]|uniref:protein SPMIP2-like n=1 Tax=Ptychodera flava TaxID=63121 RepID=UPI00396AAA04
MSADVLPFSRRSSSTSATSNATWRAKYGGRAMGKGAVLFTGPDGIGDYRVQVVTNDRYVGIGTMSQEGCSEAKYLYRAAPGTPHPRPRSTRVGEIGWGIPWYTDRQLLRTGMQIKTGEFRQASEDRHTHLYQNPWYPPPERSPSRIHSETSLLPLRPRTVHDFRDYSYDNDQRSSHSVRSRASTASSNRSRISLQLKPTEYHVTPAPDY